MEQLPAVPHMDSQGLSFFKESLSKSKCYLEYGAGGSTLFAATVAKVPAIISVESDIEWISKIKTSIGEASVRLYLEHCDVGDVGEWGAPKNNNYSENFWTYMVIPWKAAKTNYLFPDTVLIDGRFRVASFLFSLVTARVGTLILFDDYFDRPEYFVVERYCQFTARYGRMATFFVEHNYMVSDICEQIAKYSVLSKV